MLLFDHITIALGLEQMMWFEDLDWHFEHENIEYR